MEEKKQTPRNEWRTVEVMVNSVEEEEKIARVIRRAKLSHVDLVILLRGLRLRKQFLNPAYDPEHSGAAPQVMYFFDGDSPWVPLPDVDRDVGALPRVIETADLEVVAPTEIDEQNPL